MQQQERDQNMVWWNPIEAVRQRRFKRLLDKICYEPPPPPPYPTADTIARHLAKLDIKIRREPDFALIRYGKFHDKIAGWKDTLDGHDLDRVRGFLKKIQSEVAVLRGMDIPDQRRPPNA